MVLDARAMDWAAENGLDTKTLKAHKIPVFGKWYFPEIPAGEILVNLKTGQLQRFGSGMRAGEVLFVRRDDLREARLGPYAKLDEVVAQGAAAAAAPEALPDQPAPAAPAAPASPFAELYDQSLPAGERIHLPSSSIYPFVLGVGLAITMLGTVIGTWPDWMFARALIVALGLIYVIAAGLGWALEVHRDTLAAEGEEHAAPTQ